MTVVRIPELPDLPETLPPEKYKELREWCEAVEQILNIFRGVIGKGTNSRFVTIDDLIQAGLINDGDIE